MKIINQYRKWYLEHLNPCSSFEICSRSVRHIHGEKGLLGGMFGAYVGDRYREGGIVLVAINPNMGYSKGAAHIVQGVEVNPGDSPWYDFDHPKHLNYSMNLARTDDGSFGWAGHSLFAKALPMIRYIADNSKLEYDDLVFTNIVHCSHNKARSAPTDAQFGNCVYHQRHIQEELSILKPSIIICTGNLVYTSLLDLFVPEHVSKRGAFNEPWAWAGDRLIGYMPHLSSLRSLNTQQSRFKNAHNPMPDFYRRLYGGDEEDPNYEQVLQWTTSHEGISTLYENVYLHLLAISIRNEYKKRTSLGS